MYNRISIVGGSGSGKSTLCNILSKELNLPAIHLDSINFNSNWVEIDKSERDKIILEKSNEDKWIIDGNYNKKKRPTLIDTLNTIPKDKVLIFKNQRSLNNWLKEFTNNENILKKYLHV